MVPGGFQGVTRGYRGLHGVTGCYKGLEGIIRDESRYRSYKGL